MSEYFLQDEGSLVHTKHGVYEVRGGRLEPIKEEGAVPSEPKVDPFEIPPEFAPIREGESVTVGATEGGEAVKTIEVDLTPPEAFDPNFEISYGVKLADMTDHHIDLAIERQVKKIKGLLKAKLDIERSKEFVKLQYDAAVMGCNESQEQLTDDAEYRRGIIRKLAAQKKWNAVCAKVFGEEAA